MQTLIHFEPENSVMSVSLRRLAPALLVTTALFATHGLAAAQGSAAMNSPIGVWKSIDDETGKPKAVITISESGGQIAGKIDKLINPSEPNPKCDQCSGARKDQPVIGMTILWGLKSDGDEWNGGEILDPKNGKTYKAKAKLVDGGKKLEVRGFLGVSLFGRTQTWVREP